MSEVLYDGADQSVSHINVKKNVSVYQSVSVSSYVWNSEVCWAMCDQRDPQRGC